MPTTVPPGFSAEGSLRVWFATSLANPAAPTTAELAAGTTLDATCYLTSFNPDANTATVQDDRLCLKIVLEGKGSTNWTIEDLEYIFDVQNPASLSNKLYAMLPEDAVIYIVARYGMNVDTNAAAGQKVDVYTVTMGPQRKMPPERNTKGKVRQKPFVSGVPQRDVSLV